MKVYHPMGSSMTLMVAPAALMAPAERPSDFLDENKNPKRFDVKFEDGVAEVPSNLGEWLVKHEYANRTALRRVARKLLRA